MICVLVVLLALLSPLSVFAQSTSQVVSTCNGISAVQGDPLKGYTCGSVGPIRTTVTTTSGIATFSYAAAGFTVLPTVECTVENSSTTQAYVPQIASKSMTQATINVLNSQAPALTGNLLNIASIVVGQPFAPSASTGAVVVDCIAAMPTQ